MKQALMLMAALCNHCIMDTFQPHKNRGNLATNEIGILPNYIGVLCHDHWKPHYKYIDCFHALCNAHHLRELTRAWEQDEQVWAKELQDF